MLKKKKVLRNFSIDIEKYLNLCATLEPEIKKSVS